jgi:hypothetical protein
MGTTTQSGRGFMGDCRGTIMWRCGGGPDGLQRHEALKSNDFSIMNTPLTETAIRMMVNGLKTKEPQLTDENVK